MMRPEAEALGYLIVAGAVGVLGFDHGLFEERTLLDVELQPGVVVVRRERDGGEGAVEAGGGADVVEGEVGGGFGIGFGEAVGEVVGGGGREGAAEEAGADAADAEAGGLFGGEDEEFDGALGLEAGFFEGAHGFEAAEDADGAVVHAGVGDGVGVGAGADGGEVWVGAGEADEGVTDGVYTHAEACGFR